MEHDNKGIEVGISENTLGLSSELLSEVGINASGHKQELERNFSLLGICGVAVTNRCELDFVGSAVSVTVDWG